MVILIAAGGVVREHSRLFFRTAHSSTRASYSAPSFWRQIAVCCACVPACVRACVRARDLGRVLVIGVSLFGLNAAD